MSVPNLVSPLENQFRQIWFSGVSQMFPKMAMPHGCARGVLRTPRLLVNRERVGVGMFGMGGFDFDSDGTKDGFFEGDSDAAVAQLAAACRAARRR